MTVKCVTQEQKKEIIRLFTGKTATQRELSYGFNVSERTIFRILEEAGLATTVPRIKGEAYEVMQILKHYNVDPKTLNEVLGSVYYCMPRYSRSPAAVAVNL